VGNPLFELASGRPAGELTAVGAETAAVPPGCLLDTLGIVLTHVGRGRSRAQMTVGAVHLNQRGILQGGGLVAFADAAAGWAAYGALPEGRFTTLELKCNLLGKATAGDVLVAAATPVHLGRQTLVLDVSVFRSGQEDVGEARRLTARFSCTQLVLAEEAARGPAR
jgi:1,4-dihydroxy-2-naphthoyl-CoA hydrolase